MYQPRIRDDQVKRLYMLAKSRNKPMTKLIRDLPAPSLLPEGKVLVVGTADKWLNSPESLARYARMCGVDEPVWVAANHSSLTLGTVPIVKSNLTLGDCPQS